MTILSERQCEACRVDAPKASEGQIQDWIQEIPDWSVNQEDESAKLCRSYSFDNFVKAMAFANKVCDLAESENHHPEIIITWGQTTVKWWTHKIKGLHENDFILAARCDGLYGQS